MIWKIEPSGVYNRVRKGLSVSVQVRYSFYLEPSDYGYTERLSEEYVPINENGKNTFKKTGKLINVPFHNHIVQFSVDVTDEIIEYTGSYLLDIIKNHYSLNKFDIDESINILNKNDYSVPTDENILKGEIKVIKIKNNKLWQQ
jgi:hypothetical protein